MKGRAKRFLQKLLVNDLSYKLLSPFIYLGERLKSSRQNYLLGSKEVELREAAKRIFKAERVLNGPFQGLLFSFTGSSASSIYAKLLGSYEAEIQPIIRQVLQQQYDSVVNIGCDDGYYALGLAKLMPSVPVKAFDRSKAALKLAETLAHKNGLHSQVVFGGHFSASDLNNIKEDARSFFLIDIEGEEKIIFNDHNVVKLRHSDLLIELHLHIYPEIEMYLRKLFEATHDITLVNAIPDHIKAQQYNYPEIAEASYELKRFITQEREMFMQWMWLSAKTKTDQWN